MHTKINAVIKFFVLAIISVLLGQIFSRTLEWCDTHRAPPFFIPLGAILTLGIYHFLLKDLSKLRDSKPHFDSAPQFRWIPLIFLTSSVSQFFGATTGREGALIQMTSFLSRKLFQDHSRSLFLGISLGFYSAVGTPFSGIAFGYEQTKTKDWRGIAGIGAGLLLLHLLIKHFPLIQFLKIPGGMDPSQVSWLSVLAIATAGILFAEITSWTMKTIHLNFSILKGILLFSLILMIWTLFMGSSFQGMGLQWISNPEMIAEKEAPFFRWVSFLLSLATGFKGGDFLPSLAIGSSFGHQFFDAAPLGLASFYFAYTRSPISGLIFLIECFSWKLLPIAVILFGGQGIYFSCKTHLLHRITTFFPSKEKHGQSP